MTTIAEFCHVHKVNGEESLSLAYHLAAIRTEEVFSRFGINTLKAKYAKRKLSGGE